MSKHIDTELHRGSRRHALEMLFSQEFNVDGILPTPETEDNALWDEELSNGIIEGVMRHRTAIDQIITRYLRNWKIERLNKVDLIILRIAIFELTFKEDKLDKRIIIDEAIILAKGYGSDKSYKFVNGLLDAYCKDLENE